MARPPGGPSANRRWIAIGGGALALIAGLLIAALLIHRTSNKSTAPPASQGGLVVQTGRDDDIKLDPKRPLRCFVAGQFIGELPLAECAKRNGVATGALDVGLDQSGALAASGGAQSTLTPLPSAPTVAEGDNSSDGPSQAAARDDTSVQADDPNRSRLPGGCWRAEDGDWTPDPGARTLTACVRALFGGVCLRPGEASFGRFNQAMLRLYRGRVAIAPDGRNFRPLMDQDENCSLPLAD